MGKKRNHPTLQEILQRPWCYYCERDFDDLKILINHQKAKHFKCDRCNRRLNTAGGLSVHMTQVHKESLDAIEHALPNRAGLEVEIFGMEGIPEDVKQSHNQRVIAQFSQAEAERRAATGNPAPGSSGANPAKKPKLESPSDLKKRLAEHKAKMAEEAAAKATQASQLDPMQNPNPGFGQPPGMSGSAPGYGQSLGAPPAPGINGFSQPFGQPAPSTFQSPPAYGTPPGAQFNQQPQLAPPQSFPSPNNAYAPPSQYQTGASQGPPPTGPPRAFGANSPSVPYQVSPPPGQGTSLPQRPNNLPAAPGLPQRPSFGAPPVTSFQMQQMHQGQVPSSAITQHHEQQASSHGSTTAMAATLGGEVKQPTPQPPAAVSTSVNQPIEPKTENKPVEANAANAGPEKKTKKDKDKDVKLVYSDNEVSPEEKMAKLARYAFDPKEREETVLGETTATVTGVVSGEDGLARDGNRGPGRDN